MLGQVMLSHSFADDFDLGKSEFGFERMFAGEFNALVEEWLVREDTEGE